MKINDLVPHILIAAPVSDRHKHLLDEWLSSLEKLTYPNFDVMLVDTTSENEDYFNLLKTKKVKGKELIVERHKWDGTDHVVVMLAKVREKIRQYFLSKDYTHLFFLDSDVFVPEWSIQRLVSYGKDCVGFHTHIYFEPNTSPCVLKSGEIIMGKGLELFNWDEINEYKRFVKEFRENTLNKERTALIPYLIHDVWHPQLFKAYGVGIGCLMVSRKVLEVVPFRYHEKFIYGEDLWFFTEANEKHFEFWCDTDTRSDHRNTEWNSVIKKGPKECPQMYLAFGPANSDKVVFMENK